MRHHHLALLLAFGLALAGCSRQPEAPATPFKPTASIQELMKALVDPAADGIWESFSTTVTKEGIEEKRPQTDEEWAVVRHHAITLIEASNLLLIEGRKVAHPGQKLDDEGTPGLLTAPEIEQGIAKDRAGFIAAAQVLHDTGVKVLAAIDTKKPAAVVEAGGYIEAACEQCHAKFWYPNAQGPQYGRFNKAAKP